MSNKEVTPHLSQSRYAESSRAYLQVVQELRAIGGQAVVDLPRVVVIGNQSAGKSSVVEAISGINVPRDSGTCTRCPMECRLRHSDDSWSCQVSIRWEYDKNQNHMDQVSEVPFGEVITDKGDVELALRRAQAAILNPHIPMPTFLGLSAKQIKDGIESKEKPLLFSRNVVCVDLQGPDLVDLAFIDLPGIIQNSEDEELIHVVQKMVVSHIKGNSLILIALPMTDDIDNQRAVALAREADPKGERTIGVFTKPDVIGKGSKSKDIFLDIIEGRLRPLRHGYYCTRQPDDSERESGITPDQARQYEADFFRSTAPWSTSSQQQRFGVKNLLSTLSPLLLQIIKQTLPKVSDEASKRLSACNNELAKLPPPLPSEPAIYMLSLITSLSSDVKRLVEGSSGEDSSGLNLVQNNIRLFSEFKDAIKGTCPEFLANVRRRGLFQPQDADLAGKALTYPMYLDDMKTYIDNSVARELPDNVPYAAKLKLIRQCQQRWKHLADQCLKGVRTSVLDVILEQVQGHFGRWDNLQSLVRSLVTDLVDEHLTICKDTVDSHMDAERMPYTQNNHYLQTAKEKWLSRYKADRADQGSSSSTTKTAPTAPPSFNLFNNLPQTVNGAASSKKSFSPSGGAVSGFPSTTPQSGSSSFAPTPVTPTPFSFGNGSSSTTPTSGASAGQKEQTPAPTPLSPEKEKVMQQAIALLTSAGYEGLKVEDLGKLHPPDIYEREMNVMAEVRGYFQVSYKRVIDVVPMTIDLKLVHGVMHDMQDFLIQRMELGATREAAERCERYLADDPSVISRRQELTVHKEKLEKVKAKLYSFGI